MASLTILYWRDIPSQVIVKAGRKAAKRELSERFIRAIDAAAMHARRKERPTPISPTGGAATPVPCGDDLEAEAAAAAARLEAEYDTHRLARSRQARRARRPAVTRCSPRPRSSRAASGRRPTRSPRMRLWSVRHAALLERSMRASKRRSSALRRCLRAHRLRAARAAGRGGRARASRARCSTAACAATACCRRPACRAR